MTTDKDTNDLPLEERLLRAGANYCVPGHTKRSLCAESAKTIVALRAENERLRSDRDCEKRLRKDSDDQATDLRVEIEQARVEIKALHGKFGFAGWFSESPSAMSYRTWEQGGHDRQGDDVALFQYPGLTPEHEQTLDDAKRYRWLRDKALSFGDELGTKMVWCVVGENAEKSYPEDGSSLDALIDAARQPEQEGNES